METGNLLNLEKYYTGEKQKKYTVNKICMVPTWTGKKEETYSSLGILNRLEKSGEFYTKYWKNRQFYPKYWKSEEILAIFFFHLLI